MSHPNTSVEVLLQQKLEDSPAPTIPNIICKNNQTLLEENELSQINNNDLHFNDLPTLSYDDSNTQGSIKITESKIINNHTLPTEGKLSLKIPSLVIPKGKMRPVVLNTPKKIIANKLPPNISVKHPTNINQLNISKRITNLTSKPVHEEGANLLKLLIKPPVCRTPEPSIPSTSDVQSKSMSMPMLIDLFEPPPLIPAKAKTQQNTKSVLKMKILPSIIKKRFSGNTGRNETSSSETPAKGPQVETSTKKPDAIKKKPLQAVQEKIPKPTPRKVPTKPPDMERKPNILRNKVPKVEEKKKEEVKAVKESDSVMERRVENIYIADGLKEDCENLILKCLQVYKLNFEKFSEIWKQMSFSRIFHGRQSGAEIAELSEEAVHVAKAYMVARDVTFEENVAGLFIVYAFLNQQPYKGFASLRLVPDDVPAIKALEMEARKQRRHDVLYILGAVLIKGPCHLHVAPREVALELPIRKYHDGSLHMCGGSHRGVLNKTREIRPLLKGLLAEQNQLNNTMSMIEKKMGRKIAVSRPNVQMFYNKYQIFVPEKTLNRNVESQLNETEVSLTPAPCLPTPTVDQNRSDYLRSIKQKAMEKVVSPMRHLTGIAERQLDRSLTPPTHPPTATSTDYDEDKPSTSCKGKGKGKGKGIGRSSAKTLHALFDLQFDDKSDKIDPRIASILYKGKNFNIVTPATLPPRVDVSPCRKQIKSHSNAAKSGSKSPRSEHKHKRQAVDPTGSKTAKAAVKGQELEKLTIRTKRKNNHLFLNTNIDSDTDSDGVDSIPLLTLISKYPAIADKIDKCHNVNITTDSETKKVDTIGVIKPAKDQIEMVPQKLNIQLDSFPDIRNCNKNMDIEIIDNFSKGSKDNADKIETVPKKRERMNDPGDVTKKRKIGLRSDSASASLLNLAQAESRSKRKEKREFKRIRIKSKFKKLGILGVANFDDGKDSGIE